MNLRVVPKSDGQLPQILFWIGQERGGIQNWNPYYQEHPFLENSFISFTCVRMSSMIICLWNQFSELSMARLIPMLASAIFPIFKQSSFETRLQKAPLADI